MQIELRDNDWLISWTNAEGQTDSYSHPLRIRSIVDTNEVISVTEDMLRLVWKDDAACSVQAVRMREYDQIRPDWRTV